MTLILTDKQQIQQAGIKLHTIWQSLTVENKQETLPTITSFLKSLNLQPPHDFDFQHVLTNVKNSTKRVKKNHKAFVTAFEDILLKNEGHLCFLLKPEQEQEHQTNEAEDDSDEEEKKNTGKQIRQIIRKSKMNIIIILRNTRRRRGRQE